MTLQQHGARFQVRLMDLARSRSIDLEAQLDTGASVTVVDGEIASAMDLLTDRTVPMSGAALGQRTAIALRPFTLLFLDGSAVSLNFNTALGLPGLEEFGRTPLLIGRDVLARCSMTYVGATGRCTLSFARGVK